MSLLQVVGPYSIWSYGRSIVVTGTTSTSMVVSVLKSNGWRFNRNLKIHGEGTATPGWTKSSRTVDLDALIVTLERYARLEGHHVSSAGVDVPTTNDDKLPEPTVRSMTRPSQQPRAPAPTPNVGDINELDLLWQLLLKLRKVPSGTHGETVGVQSRFNLSGRSVQITYYENGELQATRWLTDHYKLD